METHSICPFATDLFRLCFPWCGMFTYVVACVRISFFLRLNVFRCRPRPHFIYPLTCDGHWVFPCFSCCEQCCCAQGCAPLQASAFELSSDRPRGWILRQFYAQLFEDPPCCLPQQLRRSTLPPAVHSVPVSPRCMHCITFVTKSVLNIF